MNVPTRLAAFVAVLVLAFGGATLLGAGVGPTDGESAVAAASHGASTAAHERAAHAGPAHARTSADVANPADRAASGLAVAEDGYALEVDRRAFTAGEAAPLTFRITDARGRTVRDEFELEHDRRLHLIVVRRDTAAFQHLHPRQRPDGSWTVDLTLVEAGTYRAYADFTIDGRQRTLATDLFVPGRFRPRPLPAPVRTDRTGGLDVVLAAPGVRAGRETALRFAVTSAGRPFDGLEPYLGAKGHLVALREGDLAYLHVHPTEDGEEHAHAPGSTSRAAHANEVAFAATVPTPGRYRLFLQLKVDGEVRTVAYTLEAAR